jgi:hypothetical protein
VDHSFKLNGLRPGIIPTKGVAVRPGLASLPERKTNAPHLLVKKIGFGTPPEV